MNKNQNFYVCIFKENGEIRAHSIAESPEQAISTETEVEIAPEDAHEDLNPKSRFPDVLKSFLSIMETYRNFIPITLSIGTAIVPAMSERIIEQFVKKRGRILSEHSSDEAQVYELNFEHLREFSTRQDEIRAASQGADHVPEVMVIGLISSYDAF